MDIREVQVKKRELEFNISKLIREFEQITEGTSVDAISVTAVVMDEVGQKIAKYTEATITVKALEFTP